jgi:hypothetical protein
MLKLSFTILFAVLCASAATSFIMLPQPREAVRPPYVQVIYLIDLGPGYTGAGKGDPQVEVRGERDFPWVVDADQGYARTRLTDHMIGVPRHFDQPEATLVDSLVVNGKSCEFRVGASDGILMCGNTRQRLKVEYDRTFPSFLHLVAKV